MRDSARLDHIDDRTITKSEGAVVGTPVEYVEHARYFDFLGNPMKGCTIGVG
jgi:hypothetical protein